MELKLKFSSAHTAIQDGSFLTPYLQQFHISCISHANRPLASVPLTQHVSRREEKLEAFEAINEDSILEANAKMYGREEPEHTHTLSTLLSVCISAQWKGRYKAAEDSPNSYVRNPLGPITIASGTSIFLCQRNSTPKTLSHNTPHYWANGPAGNKVLLPIITLLCAYRKLWFRLDSSMIFSLRQILHRTLHCEHSSPFPLRTSCNYRFRHQLYNNNSTKFGCTLCK